MNELVVKIMEKTGKQSMKILELLWNINCQLLS